MYTRAGLQLRAVGSCLSKGSLPGCQTVAIDRGLSVRPGVLLNIREPKYFPAAHDLAIIALN